MTKCNFFFNRIKTAVDLEQCFNDSTSSCKKHMDTGLAILYAYKKVYGNLIDSIGEPFAHISNHIRIIL
jgi:hypothetical protein